MKFTNKLLLGGAIILGATILTGCTSFEAVTDGIGLTKYAQDRLDARHEKEQKEEDERRNKCEMRYYAYVDSPKLFKTLLWQDFPEHRPKKENRYLYIANGSFICPTEEDLLHLNKIMHSTWQFSTGYYDNYSRLVLGTSCRVFNYPHNIIGYVASEKEIDGIRSSKVMYRITANYGHFHDGLGWVSEDIDMGVYDYKIFEENQKNRRASYRKGQNLPEVMSDELKKIKC